MQVVFLINIYYFHKDQWVELCKKNHNKPIAFASDLPGRSSSVGHSDGLMWCKSRTLF